MEAFAAGFRGEARARRHLEAVSLAEARMSELAIVAADSLAAYAKGREARFQRPFDGYLWRGRLWPAEGSPALIRAVVEVHWDGGQVALETAFYRPRRPGLPVER